MKLKKRLSLLKAKRILPSKELIHTFRNSTGMLIDCDMDKTSLIEKMKEFKQTLELSGDVARGMDHGLVLSDDTGYLFIETDKEKLNLIDPV